MARIFVFGSTEDGRHGTGTALLAKLHHGAEHGCGFGLSGSSYAIPVATASRDRLELRLVAVHVHKFLRFARANPQHSFQLTKIGCREGGFLEREIAPLFIYATENVQLMGEDGSIICKASEWVSLTVRQRKASAASVATRARRRTVGVGG